MKVFADEPSVTPVTVTTELFVNVARYPDGKVTACAHKTIALAEMYATAINKGIRGGRVIGRVRVPLTCTEGQFDV